MERKKSFSMSIDNVFYQHGIFATGKVETGQIKVGDKVKICGHKTKMPNLCASLSRFSPDDHPHLTSIKEAVSGEYIRIGLLEGSKLQIRKGTLKKFNELKYMTDIDHTVSTGNKFADKVIVKGAATALNYIAKTPQTKAAVKVVEKFAQKTYPYVENGSANLARAKTAYSEVCKKRK